MQSPHAEAFSRRLPICITVLLLGLLVGCDALPGVDGTDRVPSEPYALTAADSATVGPGIEVTLRVPDTVALGDLFRIQTRTDNRTGHMITVVSGCPKMYRFGVYDGDEVVPVKGSMRACAAVQTEIPVEPGESTESYDLRAVRSSEQEPPLAPGSYTTRLRLNWRIDGVVTKDTLETTIVFEKE